jgi:hypothetical protein
MQKCAFISKNICNECDGPECDNFCIFIVSAIIKLDIINIIETKFNMH